MKNFIPFCVLSAAAAAAATLAIAASYPPPVYVPVAGYYTDGKLVNVKAFPEEMFHNLGKCQEEVATTMMHNQESGHVIRIACLPFPETAE